MTTINMLNPRTPKEIRNLAWANNVIKSVESDAEKVVGRDNKSDDFIPSEGAVAVADLATTGRGKLTGSVNFDPESRELQSVNLEKTRPVEVEVDHMMWGTYRGTTSMEMQKDSNTTTYTVKDEVKGKITRDYEIIVDHQNQTLSYDFQTERAPWVGRTRGF